MKKSVLSVLLLLFLTTTVFPQSRKQLNDPNFYKPHKDKEFDDGSNIANIKLDKPTVDKLKKTGLVWGFIKYNHPNIANGDYNMDYELFRILPAVLNTNTDLERDQVFIDWIKKYGSFQVEDQNLDLIEGVKVLPDLDWIESNNFSEPLKKLLISIKNAKRKNKHYYIDFFAVGSPKFTNENPYESMKYPDMGFRLIALYRYWNMVQYFFPYRYMIDEDWENVLEEFIPLFINAKSETSYTLTILELIGRIKDSHAYIFKRNKIVNNYLGERLLPVEISFIENKAVVTGFYDENFQTQTDLKIGDIVAQINNQPIKDVITDRIKFNPASNYPAQLWNIARDLFRTNDKTIEIEYLRNKLPVKETLITYSLDAVKRYNRKDTALYLIKPDIAYIYLGATTNKQLPAIWERIQDTKGIILDLRDSPREFVAFSFSKYLVPDKVIFAKFTHGSVKHPGLFRFESTQFLGRKNPDYYKGKVIILVNEQTQSSSEFTAMAFQTAPNATVIGSNTAGADGDVTLFYLPGGICTGFSGVGVYYPDGRETQRIGIVPDLEVKPTIEGIKSGSDELIGIAIEEIYEEEIK